METYHYHFPRLGLELKLEKHLRIEDHGYQSSISDYFSEICIPTQFEPLRWNIQHFQNNLKEFRKQGESFGGMTEFTNPSQKPKTIHFVYCYLKISDPLFNLFVQGHEEMHAFLSAFSYTSKQPPTKNWEKDTLKEIDKKYPIFTGNLVDFLQKNRSEVLAEFGGLLTLKNYGHPIQVTYQAINKKTKHSLIKKRLRQALELFG